MTANNLTKILCGTAIAAFCATGLARAEGMDFSKVDNLPRNLWKRIDQHQKALESLDDSDAARGVYSTVWLWPPTYPKLRVCFFGGPQDVRALIARTAKEWEEQNLAIKLDFGDMNNPRICGEGDGRDNQVRIGFDKPGYWSLLGQFSVVYAKQEESSMNFEGFDKTPVDKFRPYDYGTIRHEFGHAIGLYHEHQSPDGHCDQEYNWDFLYNYLKGPPNNWPKDQIDFNLRSLDTSQNPGVMLSEFDKTSVMLYQFPANFYLKGEESRCYVPEPNDEISATDRAVVDYMYPVNPQARIDHFEKNKAAFAAIWNKSSEEGKKGVMIDMMKTFFESPGNAGQ